MRRYVGLIFFISSLAVAASPEERVTVYHEPYPQAENYENFEAKFHANTERTGSDRAWIEIAMGPRVADTDRQHDALSVNKNVAGLSYNSEKAEIVYRREKSPDIVCAKAEKGSFLFFSWDRMDLTGACELKTEAVTEKVDDGISVGERRFLNVVLVLHPDRGVPSERQSRTPAFTQKP